MKGIQKVAMMGAALAAMVGGSVVAAAPANATMQIYQEGTARYEAANVFSVVGRHQGGQGNTRSAASVLHIGTVRQGSNALIAGAQAPNWQQARYVHPAESNTRGRCYWRAADKIGGAPNPKLDMVCMVDKIGGITRTPADSVQSQSTAEHETVPASTKADFSWSVDNDDNGQTCLTATSKIDPAYSSTTCASPEGASELGLALGFTTDVDGSQSAYYVPPTDEATQARALTAGEPKGTLVFEDSVHPVNDYYSEYESPSGETFTFPTMKFDE